MFFSNLNSNCSNLLETGTATTPEDLTVQDLSPNSQKIDDEIVNIQNEAILLWHGEDSGNFCFWK